MTSGMLRQVNNKGDTSRSSPLVRALRATCCVLGTIRGMLHKCHLPKRDNKSVCLSAQLLFSCGMPLIVMDLYQNLIMSNISLVNAAAQPRPYAVCPSVRSARRLSRCLVVPFAIGQVAAAVAKRSWPRSCSRCHCHCRSHSRCHCHCPRPLHRLLKRNAIQSV